MIDRSLFVQFLLIPLIVICSANSGQAQSFDYEPRPVLDYRFTEASIDLSINPDDAIIAGSVMYRLQANINGADTLQLDAPEMQIDSVRSQGQSMAYNQRDDDLMIAVTDSSVLGQEYKLEIFYRTTPQFGLLKSSEGTIWTSVLPRSTRHWLPVKDHPRVRMITTLSLQIPAQYAAFASGVRTDSEVLSTKMKRLTFRTGQPIPVTSLSFGFGQLRQEGTSMGIKRIDSFAETGSISSSVQSQLVERARQILSEIEQQTEQEYPYQRLNLVILNDHYWEQKSYGASTIFLYKNRGDWESQLRRGLYGQWFGVHRNEAQWSDARAIKLLQTALHYQLSDAAATLQANVDEPEVSFQTVYDNFSAENWNWWQQYPSWNMPTIKQVTAQLIPMLLQGDDHIISGNSFAERWYRASGQPSLNLPEYESIPQATNGSATQDTVVYRVDYKLNSATNSLELLFNAQQRAIQQPLTVPLEITTGGAANTTEVTFSGSVDSASVSLPAGVQNVRLIAPQDRNLIFEEHKPVSFALYQLRNGESPQVRKEAAIQLGYHTDNPDLQLALTDLMNRDMAPEVEAELLKTYGKITAGADGTQQQFIEALSSESELVRKAALEFLDNYQGEQVTGRLRTYFENETNPALTNRALNMYMQRVDSTTALQFTNSIVQQDTAGTKAITAIDALAEAGNTEQAVKLAGFYIEPVYAYSVRRQALQVLLRHDQSAESWKKRTEMLINDFDPRIRYLTVQNIGQIPGIQADELISTQMESEYDARVHGVMGHQ